MKRISQFLLIPTMILCFLISKPLVGLSQIENINAGAYGLQTHIVKEGETLYSIARQYEVSPKDIIAANESKNSALKPGIELIIPSKEVAETAAAEEMARNQNQVPPALANLESSAPSSSSGTVGTRSLDEITGSQPGSQEVGTRSLSEITSSQPTAAGASSYSSPSNQADYYTLQYGDDIFSVSDSKNVSIGQLKEWNPNATFRPGESVIVGMAPGAGAYSAKSASSQGSTRSLSTSSPAAGEQVGDLSALGGQSQNMGSVGTRSLATMVPQSEAPQSSSTPPQASSGGKRGAYDMPELGTFGKTVLPNQRFGEYQGPRISNDRFYALHRSIPVGTKVNVVFPGNKGLIQVIIVEQLPPESQFDISLSPEAISLITGGPNDGTIKISY